MKDIFNMWMNRFHRWAFKWSAYDFEGRCAQCGKKLNLKVYITPGVNSIELVVDECKGHPKQAMILIPQRPDVKIQ